MAKSKPRTSKRTKKTTRAGKVRNALTRVGVLWRPRWIVFGGTFVVALGAGGAWGAWQNLCAGDACPSIAQIKTWEPEQTSKLLSHDGRLIAEIGFERRTPVSIHALPEYVPQAVIAIEDSRFYEHGGFDPRGLARAVYGIGRAHV